MKKVAAVCLILSLMNLTLPETGAAQSVARASAKEPRLYIPRFGPGQADDRSEYLDERDRRRKKRRRQAQQAETEQYPDYERPSHLIEMGIRFAPSLSLNTVAGTGDYARFTNNGAGVRLSVGPTLDYFFFKDRYAFSTGLWYTIKRSGYQMPGSFGQTVWNPGAPAQESAYNLQYVQLPATAKLFANNVAPNLRVYVQTGGLLSLKLAERALNPQLNGLYKYAESSGRTRQYSFGDVELLLGTGVQYKLSPTYALNLGVSYQRGLLDVARGRDLVSKNRLVALEVGFRF